MNSGLVLLQKTRSHPGPCRAAGVAASSTGFAMAPPTSSARYSGVAGCTARWASNAFERIMATALHPPQQRLVDPHMPATAAVAAVATHAPCGGEAKLQEDGARAAL